MSEELHFITIRMSFEEYYHFVGGKRKIDKEELEEAGDRIFKETQEWYKELPVTDTIDFDDGKSNTRFDPDTGEIVYESNLPDIWFKRMSMWLRENGYILVPEGCPEYNYEDKEAENK